MMQKLLLSIVFVTALFGEVFYEDAYKLYKEGKFKESLKMFQTLADEQQDNDAAYILGYMYEHGEGCEVDIAKSQKYYKASSKGYYWQIKADPNRDSNKEYKKVFKILDKPEDKETEATIQQYVQSLYNIKAHNANYFLPISTRLDNTEYAKTGVGASAHTPLQTETEFQVSIKYDMYTNLLGLGEIYTIAYTQRSFWQLYVESAYFRESNYNPEGFVTFPIKQNETFHFLKGVKLGLAHQSNGRGGLEERSWNYLYSTFYFQYETFFSELKLWTSLERHPEYNRDLIDYLGNVELKFSLPYKKHLAQMAFRSAFNEHYSVEANYSYPLFGREDLFFYVKAFSGYGESLIDYNNNVQKLGFGFSISR